MNYLILSRAALLGLGTLFSFGLSAVAQQAGPEARSGQNFISTRVFTLEEDQKILQAFEGLRVADVTDGMDAVGLHNVGLVDPEIEPLWKDPKEYKHRFIGIAVTARYVPTQQPPAGEREEADFDAWVGNFYNTRSSEPFMELLRPGSALVIDDANGADVGSIGSNNILQWKMRGCVGVVTDATARDTDEIITQEVPLYFREPGRGIRPGRNEIESVNRPVEIGGALVMPGDVVVADGDGIVIVPRDHALRVAAYAHKIIEGDKAGRRNLYKELGLPDDPSVK